LIVAEEEDSEGDEDAGEVAVVERKCQFGLLVGGGCCSSTAATTHMSDFPVRGPRPPVGGMANAKSALEALGVAV